LFSEDNYSGDKNKKDLIFNAVKNELKLHSNTTLAAIYKNFFWSEYYPAHFN